MESIQTSTEFFQGDGFFIKNGIIKGIENSIRSSNFNNIGELMWENMSKSPEFIAQIDAITGKKKTFEDLRKRSIHLALWMKKEGIKSGDIVTLCSSDYLDFDVIIFATLFIGAIYNAFPCQLDLMLARRFIKHIEPSIIFVCKDEFDTLQKALSIENHKCKMVVLDDEDNGKQSFNNILNVHSSDEVKNFQITSDVRRESLCLIIPTSGTTGIPKFVSYSHAKILQTLTSTSRSDRSTEETYIPLLSYLAPSWMIHFTTMLIVTVWKRTRIFVKYFDPLQTFYFIEKYKVSELVLTSHQALLCCNADRVSECKLDSLLKITSMGFRLPKKAIEKSNKIFLNAYHYRLLGSTEANSISKYTGKSKNPESQGTVMPNVQLKIINVNTGKTLGANEVGEICIKSPYIMSGYYKNPVETALLYDDDGWFHTGDEAYYDENGEIVIVGRLSDLIKYSADIKIQASDVETILMSHPAILEAAVIGISNDVCGEQPVACIKKLQGSEITERDVLNQICELKGSCAFKNFIIFIDEIPRTMNGKIDKRILKERVEKMFISN